MGANEKCEAAMHGYVPSTESVREEYRNGRQFGELYSKTDFRAEFDRWLETVRAEAKAEAWDEGWCVGWGNAWDSAKLTGAELVMTGNPYKEAPNA